jgi:hypothetical protein
VIAIPTSPKNDRPSSSSKSDRPFSSQKKTITSPHSQKAIALIITKNDRPLRSYPKQWQF